MRKLIIEKDIISECKKENCIYKECAYKNYKTERDYKTVPLCKNGNLEKISVNDLEIIDFINKFPNQLSI